MAGHGKLSGLKIKRGRRRRKQKGRHGGIRPGPTKQQRAHRHAAISGQARAQRDHRPTQHRGWNDKGRITRAAGLWRYIGRGGGQDEIIRRKACPEARAKTGKVAKCRVIFLIRNGQAFCDTIRNSGRNPITRQSGMGAAQFRQHDTAMTRDHFGKADISAGAMQRKAGSAKLFRQRGNARRRRWVLQPFDQRVLQQHNARRCGGAAGQPQMIRRITRRQKGRILRAGTKGADRIEGRRQRHHTNPTNRKRRGFEGAYPGIGSGPIDAARGLGAKRQRHHAGGNRRP